MKKYTRFRNADELREACAALGWSLETGKYDEGSDHVVIKFTHEGIRGEAFVSMFNGRFFGRLDDDLVPFSSDDGKMEGQPWFEALLETVYLNFEVGQKVHWTTTSMARGNGINFRKKDGVIEAIEYPFATVKAGNGRRVKLRVQLLRLPSQKSGPQQVFEALAAAV